MDSGMGEESGSPMQKEKEMLMKDNIVRIRNQDRENILGRMDPPIRAISQTI